MKVAALTIPALNRIVKLSNRQPTPRLKTTSQKHPARRTVLLRADIGSSILDDDSVLRGSPTGALAHSAAFNRRHKQSRTAHKETGKNMADETIDGAFRQTNLLNESAAYIAEREKLRLAEIELMSQQERVSAMRRKLPEGPEVQDYEFIEGSTCLDDGDTARTVRMSELFTLPDRALIIYHFMYGKKNVKPCPMCTAMIDSLNGIAHHLAQNINLAIAAAADLPQLRGHARARGWDKLRLLNCGDNTFKFDLGSENREGQQDSEISVFTLKGGKIRHSYSAHPRMSKEVKERGLDLINPIWNVLDLTPQGRGDWYASLDYGTEVKSLPRAS